MADENVIEMHPVPASSRVKAMGYDAETQTLQVEFPKSGKIARYTGVPEEVYRQVVGAASVGQAFGALIVDGGYPFEYV
jgi:hypothetical protein